MSLAECSNADLSKKQKFFCQKNIKRFQKKPKTTRIQQKNKADFVVENDEIDNDAPKKVLKYIKNLISDHL